MKVLLKSTFTIEKPQRASISTYRGNYVDFVATILNYAVPAELSDDTVKAYYQPLDGDYSDSLFSFESVESSGNIVTAHWLPSYDVGASRYRVWIECADNDGTGYPAMFEMEMLGNPVYDLNPTNPPAKKILDFGKFELINAPWVETADFVESITEIEDKIDDSTNSILSAISNISVDVDLPTDYAKEATLTSGISTIVNKIDNIEIPETDFTEIETALGAIQDSVDSINIPSIPTDYAKEATLTAGVSTITRKFGDIDERFDQIYGEVEHTVETTQYINESLLTKASQESVDAIKTAVDSIEIPAIPTDYATSAQAQTIRSDLSALSSVVSTKASQASMNRLDEMTESIQGYCNDIDATTRGIASDIDNLESEAENIKHKIDDVRDDVQRVDSVVDEIETHVVVLRNTIDNITIPSDYATSAQASQILTKVGEVDEALSQIIGG